MKPRTLILIALPILLVLFGIANYNSIQTKDETAQSAQQQIEVQLQRRADLVPNLVETVKGYAKQEMTIFTEVAQARAGLAGAVQGRNVGEMARANDAMTGALGRLLAISENYPQLKSDANFLRLQDELAGTENRIAVSRTDYNGAVRDYNTYIRRFPAVIVAKLSGAAAREYFEVERGRARGPEGRILTVRLPGAPAAERAPRPSSRASRCSRSHRRPQMMCRRPSPGRPGRSRAPRPSPA